MKMDTYAVSLDSSLDLPLLSGWGVVTTDMWQNQYYSI